MSGPTASRTAAQALHVHLRSGANETGFIQVCSLIALVAALEQPLGVARVVLGRGEPARHFVAAHRAAVGRHLVAIGADQLVDRHAELASGEVPQRQLDDRQRPVAELAGAAALPVRQALPHALAVERILPISTV